MPSPFDEVVRNPFFADNPILLNYMGITPQDYAARYIRNLRSRGSLDKILDRYKTGQKIERTKDRLREIEKRRLQMLPLGLSETNYSPSTTRTGFRGLFGETGI